MKCNGVLDLVGHRFGQWLVLSRGPAKNNSRMWECVCGCGEIKYVAQSHLVRGKSTQCLKCLGKQNSEKAEKVKFLSGPSNFTTQSQWAKRLKQEKVIQQNGICPICLKPLPINPSEQCFDHNHLTLQSRAIVHRGCNVFIGFIERDPEIAERTQKYLESH